MTTSNTIQRSRSGLRQLLLLIAPAVALCTNAFLPWSEVLARVGGDPIHKVYTFADLWQGKGALICTILGVVVGAGLILVKNMALRRKLTSASLLLSMVLIGLCVAFQATMPQTDPLMAVEHKGTTLYMGLGMGLHLTEALGIAWFFAALSAWSWRRDWTRRTDRDEN